MVDMNVLKVANEVLKKWYGPSQYSREVAEWSGPTGQYWCKEKDKFIDPNSCKDCTQCEAIDEVDHHPSKYLRPTDISW